MARMDRSASPSDAVNFFAEQALPPAALFSGKIITGSHAVVTDNHPWNEKAAGLIKQAVAAEIPVLGSATVTHYWPTLLPSDGGPGGGVSPRI